MLLFIQAVIALASCSAVTFTLGSMINEPSVNAAITSTSLVALSSSEMVISEVTSSSVMVTNSVPSLNVMVTSPLPSSNLMVASSLPSPNVMVTSPLPSPNVMVTSPLPSSNVIVTSPLPSPNVMVTSPLPSPNVMFTSSLPSPNVVVTSPIPSSNVMVPSPLTSPLIITAQSSMELPTASMTIPPLSASEMVPILVGCVGGGLAALFITFTIAAMCYCKCYHGSKYVISHLHKGKATNAELGVVTSVQEPILGVPCYRVSRNYKPLNKDDLQLRTGDVVTLVQATSSKEWWEGTVGEQNGWFPKICVEYFDPEAEKKARQKVGTITPKSEKMNKLNRSFRRMCGMEVTSSCSKLSEAASHSHPESADSHPQSPDSHPQSPDSMIEVIINEAALNSPHEAMAADYEIDSLGGSGDGRLPESVHSGNDTVPPVGRFHLVPSVRGLEGLCKQTHDIIE